MFFFSSKTWHILASLTAIFKYLKRLEDLNTKSTLSGSGVSWEIKKLIEKVPERVLFGSDYSGCSQREHIQFVKKLELEEGIEKRVFERNAVQVYSLNM